MYKRPKVFPAPKLSPEQRRNLIEDRKSRMTYRALSKKYGITYQRVQAICKRAGVEIDLRRRD